MENDFSPVVIENKENEDNPHREEVNLTETIADENLKETELKIAEIVKEIQDEVNINQLISNPYACNICDYKTVRSDSLTMHLNSHTQENSGSCNMPDHKSKKRNTLTNTINENPFSCKICNLDFPTKSNLQIHARIHTGEKPFACKICDHRTSSKTALQKHLKVIHTEPYGCGICNANFADKVSLKDHFLTIHSLQT